jgi:PAS domain S-box-containing protein/diguanylate cyclase (GGDEF)-like protein
LNDSADSSSGEVSVLLDDPFILRAVVDSLPVGVCLADSNLRVIYWNLGAEQITGFLRHEVLGRPVKQSGVLHVKPDGTLAADDPHLLEETVHDGKRRQAQFYLRHRAGHHVPVSAWSVPIRDARNLIIGAVECFEVHDTVAAQARHNATLAAHGCLDFVTGLPNRGMAMARLRESLALYSEYHLPFGLIAVQLDDLRAFEEAHSSAAVHAILHVCAQTIAHALPATAFLSRWTEDQFLAVIPECDRVELEKLWHEIHRAVNGTGIQWWGDSLTIQASVGWGLSEPKDTLDTLLERLKLSLAQEATSEANGTKAKPVAPGNREG